MKWDGHTHSQFCLHGSGEKTVIMVERAVRLGFRRYSIVEHAPLPDEVIANPEKRLEFGLAYNQLNPYFEHIAELKKTYENRIEILAGLEIDYFEGMEDFAHDLVKLTDSDLDDVIFSIHFLKAGADFISIDYHPDDFEQGLLNYYGSINAVHGRYWETLLRLAKLKIKLPNTKRIGHIDLINKFQDRFPRNSDDSSLRQMQCEVFKAIKANGWAIDYNVAGLNQKWLQRVYLADSLLNLSKKQGINLVYGSDAHSVDAVGRAYDRYLTAIKHNHSTCGSREF